MGKDKKTKKPVVSSSSSSDSDSPPPKKVDKKKAKKDKKEVEKKKAEPVKKDKKSKKKVESSDSDSSDAKPVKKRERAASNVSAASKGSANKAQKKSEKAVVPQKKSKDQDSSSDSSEESVKVAKKAESSDDSSDEKQEAKVEAKVETPAAVIDEHDGKLELYVQELSFNTYEDSLRAFFETYGELAKCKLLMSMGKTKCKAFIQYHDHQHAKAALNGTIGQNLDGRPLRVEWSSAVAPGGGVGGVPDGETKSIFIGNLGFRTEAWHLDELFKSCGTITKSTIGMGQDGRPRGYAHVDFDSNAAAVEALKLAGTEIEGRAIRVDLSIKKDKGRGGFRGGRGGDRGGRGSRGGGEYGPRGGSGYNREPPTSDNIYQEANQERSKAHRALMTSDNLNNSVYL